MKFSWMASRASLILIRILEIMSPLATKEGCGGERGVRCDCDRFVYHCESIYMHFGAFALTP